MAPDARPILGLHRPVPQLERADVPGRGPPAIPATVPVHRRILGAPVDRAGVGIDRVDHRAPRIGVLLIARDEQRVGESDRRPRNPVAILALAGDRIHRTEAPAVGVVPPLPLGPADGAIECHVARDDAAVLLHPRQPRVHVLDEPALVLRLVVQEIGVERQRGGDEIEEVIADDVGVLLIVREELLVAALAMQRDELRDVERIPHPVERRRLPEHRAAAAVDHRLDDLALRIVVRRVGILPHVERRIGPRPLLVGRQRRRRQRQHVERPKRFAMVHPVGLHRKILVVHALAADRHVGRPGLGELANHALPRPQMQLEDLVARPQRMQLRPAGRVLEGIVRAVVGAPSDDVPKVAALVVVLREERFHRRDAVSENPPLQRCPLGRGHGSGDVDRGPCGPKEGERQKAETEAATSEEADSFAPHDTTHRARLGGVDSRKPAQPPAPTDVIGHTISHYRIVDKLGSGGMGVVYKAEDLRLGRLVALKFLSDAFARDPRALERLNQEARVVAALEHENICTIYDIGEHEGSAFIAMQLLEGITLADRLVGGPLAIEEATTFGIEIASGLDRAHRGGVVHRDLKPGNVFITRDGHVKLLDFGLAKVTQTSGPQSGLPTIAAAPLTNPGLAVGTVGYMSPEQARGEELDVRSDLFSLGAVLYEMVTGRSAFSGSTSAVMFDAILNRTPESASQINPDVPPMLCAVISKALERDREIRYQSAADLRADLRRLRRESTSGYVPSTTAVPQRSRRAWTWVAAAAGLIAAAAAVLIVWTPGSGPVNPWASHRLRLFLSSSEPVQTASFSADAEHRGLHVDSRRSDGYLPEPRRGRHPHPGDERRRD